MKNLLTRRIALLSGAAMATTITFPGLANAAITHEVQMLNKHPDDSKLRQIFYPRIVVIDPGDTVTFVAANKGHNSASVDGMIPAGTEAWKSQINKDASITFTTPGFYGYQCTPHVALGMVGLVVVRGDTMLDNLDAAKGVKQRGRAKTAWEEIFAEVENMDFDT